MQRDEQRLVDDCKEVRTLLEVDGEVPEWVSLTACVEDAPTISAEARDLWLRCGWLVP